MGDRSKIAWTESTWNPVTGCTKVSQGCANCYAEATAKRMQAASAERYRNGFRVTAHPNVLDLPLRWQRPRRVFVNSMSDLFHKDVPVAFIDQVFGIMLACATLEGREHTFQVLTKRPENMRAYLTREAPNMLLRRWAEAVDHLVHVRDGDILFSEVVANHTSNAWGPDGTAPLPGDPNWSHPENLWPLPNVWLGTSVEDQENADRRIPELLATPAAVRLLSCEPLLGEVDLRWLRGNRTLADTPPPGATCDWGGCNRPAVALRLDPAPDGHGWLPVCTSHQGIGWVIVGGESGPKARPMEVGWARQLRDQCETAGVAFFMKQLGERLADERGLASRKGQDPEEWEPALRVREYPRAG